MSGESFIQKKKTDRNAKALADNFLNKWNQNKNSSTQELLWLIKNYKNFNSRYVYNQQSLNVFIISIFNF